VAVVHINDNLVFLLTLLDNS